MQNRANQLARARRYILEELMTGREMPDRGERTLAEVESAGIDIEALYDEVADYIDRVNRYMRTSGEDFIPEIKQTVRPGNKTDPGQVVFDDIPEKGLIDTLKLLGGKHTTYFTVTGDSMVGADIYPEDIIVVDSQPRQHYQNKVVALWLNNRFYVKRLIVENGSLVLRSANPEYSDYSVKDHDEMHIIGIVKSILRQIQ